MRVRVFLFLPFPLTHPLQGGGDSVSRTYLHFTCSGCFNLALAVVESIQHS